MPETPHRPLGVALIGYAFMGRAHSQAWRTVGAAFDVPPIARRVIVGRDEQAVAEATLAAERASRDEARAGGMSVRCRTRPGHVARVMPSSPLHMYSSAHTYSIVLSSPLHTCTAGRKTRS